MASPSRKTCLQCKASASASASATDSFRNGWRLRSGEFAQLCHPCGSAYEKGVFCEVFHSNDGGWRDCEACGKLVHCGCIVSFNTYLPVDFGGIMCNDCSRISLILARNDGSFHERSVLLDDPQRDPATKNRRESQYRPHVSAASELHQTCINPNSIDPPVYEKKLLDNDLKLSRLVLPSKCAEALFPKLQGQHLMPVSVLDTDGKQWEFFFCCCSNPTNTMYVLDGLRDYVIAQKCQPGDTVTFCKTKPGGKVMMGLRKTSVASST